jgi:DNA gyrase subunit A
MTVIPIREFREGLYLLMATRDGIIKKTDLMEFENIRKGGLIALNIMDNDELIDVKLTEENMDLIFVTANGMSIRVSEASVRPMGRTARGVKSMKLDEDDYIIGMEAFISDKTELLAVTANGFGKRTEIDEYRTQSRNGKGILTYRVTEKTGKVVGIALVNDNDDVMLINSDGTIIRLHACDISILGRTTQGVTLMRIGEGVSIMSIATVVKEEESSEDDETDDGVTIPEEE